jgi:uncharacterized membrane protein
MQSWQGQFPPPEAIERYDKVHPGAFDRILTMAEKIESAQIEQSAQALRYQHQDTSRAQWLGFSLAAIAVICAAVLGAIGQPWLAGVFLAVPVMGAVKSLVDSGRSGNAATVLNQGVPTPPSTGVANKKG